MKKIRKMSDDENVNRRPKLHKTPVFTTDERKLLLKLVNLHYDAVNAKPTNHIIIKQKRQAWQTIHKTYLENTKLITQPRTLKQLQRCWDNIKSKAKKGEPGAVELMQCCEDQDNLRNEKTCTSKDIVNSSTISLNGVGEDSDAAPTLELLDHELKDKPDEIQNSSKQSLDESFLKLQEALDNSKCTHCGCEKIEKNAKVQLMISQKHLNEELHQLEMHLIKERLKNERELHKLHVHEMSLKIENERRRAVILDKELGN